MESDRELLELAAKAAGYEINFEEPVNGWYANGYDDNGDPRAWWNPLTDDGDALRLAVKLNINIDDAVYLYCDMNICSYADPYSATRRAIVRAAAEIGRRMKDADKERK